MKKTISFLLTFFLLAVSVNAANVTEGLGDPGLTPDSPFYFANGFLNMFKSRERVANERASAVVAMAMKEDEKALEVAMRDYEKALERRTEEADRGEDNAEAVAEQTTNHLEVLARVQEQVPEQARESIGLAMQKSVENRERSIERLSEMNPGKGQEVAQRTLQRVMENTPQQAQEGLMRAMDSVAQRMPDGIAGREDRGRPSGAPNGTDSMPVDIPEQGGQEERPEQDGGAPDNVTQQPTGGIPN